MSKKDIDDKEVNLVLEKSKEICKKLNYVLEKESVKMKEMQIGTAFYSIARFAAQFLYDVRPVMGDDVKESFKRTLDDIMQAYEDEGPDKTSRILKFVHGGEDN